MKENIRPSYKPHKFIKYDEQKRKQADRQTISDHQCQCLFQQEKTHDPWELMKRGVGLHDGVPAWHLICLRVATVGTGWRQQ